MHTRTVLFISGIALLGVAYSTVRAQAPQSVLDGIYTDAQATRGQQVYTDHCATCHGDQLMGTDSGGPPLAGNDFVADFKDMPVAALLGKISTDMPSDAPGTLEPAQYADVLAYVLRFNKYPAGQMELPQDPNALAMVKMADPPAAGAAAPSPAGAPAAAASPAAPGAVPQSVLDGVFTAAQAMRGQQVFTDHCATCHGDQLMGTDSGGPPLVGNDFIADFKDMPLAALLGKISTDMPSDAPGTLEPAQYADVLAYVLSFNKYPVGQAELPTDPAALSSVKMANPPQ
jgi:mono/diheme cytochrome c family protein